MKDTIKSCYYDINGKEPTIETILKIAKEMPKEIHQLASQWDWNDTEVRDQVYIWIRDSYMKEINM